MTIRFDALLVRALADELAARCTGERVRAAQLGRTARLVITHGRAGALRVVLTRRTCAFTRTSDRAARRSGVIPPGWRVEAIGAPGDERILIWTFASGEGERRKLVLELLTNRHNALVLDETGRIRAALFAAASVSGDEPGGIWRAPDPSPRAGTRAPVDEKAFRARLEAVPPLDRSKALVAAFAWTSPINADAVLGDAARSADPALLTDAWRRYVQVTHGGTVDPCILSLGQTRQPYPVRLPDTPLETVPDLLAAFEAAHAGEPVADEEAEAHWRRMRERAESRIARLRAQADGAPADAVQLRHRAGLLLAQLDRIPRGANRVQLDDFAGGSITIELDPAVRPAEYAGRLYEEAKRRERAAARVPALIRNAERERERFALLEASAARGEPTPVPAHGSRSDSTGPVVRLPYRRYRTSGGLEVRVGRGARANDDLTFHHSSPDDIWLHARGAGGAHVILRWTSRDANPPASDLREAAVLAALHSRARTSGTVPVDWTRRKYVRKPRKAPPGLVSVERTRTLFVSPSRDFEERLREPH
ncbi:MAG: NFACT RNA binding domain-containing protein [Gemmatimonadetes bacterium]|nr:NFACT RNA binding domain-containing protein [Gemmatimonadota bacterium]